VTSVDEVTVDVIPLVVASYFPWYQGNKVFQNKCRICTR
jgi:hypothetical protein